MMGRTRFGVSTILGLVLAALVAGAGARAATKAVDLDGNAANGAESQCDLNVLQTFPVKIENKVTNKTGGVAFSFSWPSAGPDPIAGSHYDQEVDQFDDLTSAARTTETAKFWTVDAAVGWRLPRRLGSISLEGTNLLDHQFDFYEQSLQENVIPARRVALRADFAF